MITVWSVGALALAALILGAMIRLFLGPTAPDRVVALDTINSLVVGLMILLAAVYRQSVFVDVAIVYALLSFVGTLFIARYLKRNFQ
jgi:multicomponent Na+:H+ antiporter subunit F